MEIEILNAANGEPLGNILVQPGTTMEEVRKFIYEELNGLALERQRLHLDLPFGKVLGDDETVETLELSATSKIYVKDLGMQIGYRMVYIAEYLGALLIYQYFYINRFYPYDNDFMLDLAAACNMVHYLRRLYESLYVHRFSRSTMPLYCLFRNCAYYWGFTAYIAWDINEQWCSSVSNERLCIGLLIFLLSEIGNFEVHLALRNLRTPGTAERRVPMPVNFFTKLFDWVSCPNYTYEICAWLAFALMTASPPALGFATVGACQMSQWALKKHKKYLEEFDCYPKKRRAIFPYIL